MKTLTLIGAGLLTVVCVSAWVWVCVCVGRVGWGGGAGGKEKEDNRIKQPDIEKGDGASLEASTPMLIPLPGTLHTLETLFTQQP